MQRSVSITWKTPDGERGGWTTHEDGSHTDVYTTAFETEYLRVVLMSDTGKTKRWGVRSVRHGDVLGEVRWYGPWRQYVFFPGDATIWNKGCLEDVNRFLDQAMADYRLEKKARA